MEKLHAAVIGLGIGRHHVDAYARHPAVELAALCDASPERLATALAQHPEARGYATPDRAFSSDGGRGTVEEQR